MSVRKLLFILLILLLLPFAFKANGGDFGQSQSLFTDNKANKVGDILTVLVYEQIQASNQVQTKTEKSSDASTSGGPGEGPLLKLIPKFGMESQQKSNFDGKGENTRNGVLRGKISVNVIGVKDNGDLIIEGSRVVGISGDREVLTLSGVVRQKDIGSDNSVNSYLIADAEVKYTGKGNANTGARPGFITRLINWLF